MQTSHRNEVSLVSREDALRLRYGELLTAADLADIFRYPSAQAVLKARARGQFLVPLIKFPARRGWFATVRQVAEFFDAIETAKSAEEISAS